MGSESAPTVTHADDGAVQVHFRYRDRPFDLVITATGTLELYLDGVLRKDRPYSGQTPQYVWTNVELQWEEHHYLEVRYWAAQRCLQVTINRAPLHELTL